LAQQVEHNTFNVGVLGSSPKRITERRDLKKSLSFSKLLIARYTAFDAAFLFLLHFHLTGLPVIHTKT
ncbi:MAG: hypothetical protein IIU87_08460, partial [Prevotella sp.]|nr:hypothetical protein [Prevotella sp.]